MKRPATLFIAALTSVLFLSGVALAQDKPAPKPAEPPTAPKAVEPVKKDQSKKTDEPKKDDKPKTANPENKNLPDYEFVKMSTSKGDIYLKLNRAKAPISVENFLKYADAKYYDGTIFHRVIKDFMIQGGGFLENVTEKSEGRQKPIKNEWQNGLSNKKGTIAMARTQVADSATSQFFINTGDQNGFLDQPRDGAGYAVFGEVVAGMDVVEKIQSVKTTTKRQMENVPVETITITSVTRSSEEASRSGHK
jgi:peptidyl-prolyl cis-trans isomerase A (cyclophilin A)